jgi:hypothetical protein
LWPVTPASHFPQPESASAQKTLGTSGHTSPDQYELFDLDYASLRMSKDTSPSASEKSLESWNQSVIKARGEYSLRLKSGRLTSASGSSSWPTIRASEYKDTGHHMLGKGYLCAVVTQDAANWPTPDTSNHRDGEVLRKDNNLEQGGFHGVSLHHAMTKYGQAAPANPSTDGSRQGLWPTITAHTPDMESNGPNGNSGTYLAGAVKQWATPNAFCYQPPENTEKWTKRAEYQQTEKGVNLHKPIQTQVLHEVEKQWRTPSSSDGEGGVMEMREGCAGKYKLRDHVVAEQKSWATPIMGDSHLASTPEVAQKRIEEGKVTLSRQNPGKLNPRWVETLQGVCMGWTSPSCPASVIKNWPKFVSGWCALTIEPTNFDSSETESSQPPPSELFAF